MEVLVSAGCTSQIQTRHSSKGSERKTIEQHDTPQQPQTGLNQNEGRLHSSPGQSTKYQSTKLLKVQERYSQGKERIQHCVIRLPLRSLEAVEYDTLKLQWICKT